MHPTDDSALLRQYVENQSDEAFAALVTRHINLVYSVALRSVGDPHQAEEITQGVFILLAAKAAQLRHDRALSSWLFQATRLTASNFVRSESRRHHREQEAHMQSLLDETGNDVWRQIAPLLDDAVAGLSETDRHAIVLRFYEGRNLREVGAALGASEDAAEKRVNRAVEKLRTFFAKRGVTASSAAVAVVLGANAVEAAPVGLAATIATAAALAGTTIATTATVTAVKTIAMTTLQKTLIASTLAVAVGTVIYEAQQASTLRTEVQELQLQQAPLAEQIQQLQREHDAATNRLALSQKENALLKQNTAELLKLRGEMALLKAAAVQSDNDTTKTAAQSWLSRVDQLKNRLTQDPAAKIPELQFVTEQDWLNAARGELHTEADYRRALSTLRSAGESKVGSLLKKALTGYMRSNSGQKPTDLGQLKPYFDSPLNDAVLQRWEIAPATTVKSLGLGGDVIITQKAAVDEVFDTRYGIGPDGFGSTDFLSREVAPTMDPVWEAFRAAHNGQWPDDVSQLQPYATTPEQQAALQKLMLKNSNSK